MMLVVVLSHILRLCGHYSFYYYNIK